MIRLSDCPDCLVSTSHGAMVATLEEPKTGHKLTLRSESLFELRTIDLGDRTPDLHWPPAAKRPDGVLIARRGDETIVCFIELKGNVDLDAENFPLRAYEQCMDGVRHFSPAEPHGRIHHDQWNQGDDLPVDSPDAGHRVVGVVLVQRGGSRGRSATRPHAGKDVALFVVQKSGRRHHVDMTVDEFLANVALP